MSLVHKILVVDDEVQNRIVFSRLLEKNGFLVEAVATGEEALKLLGGKKFDAVLLDYMLPEMSGLDVLKTIRVSSSAIELPVIMVTANNEQDFVTRCFEVGANDYAEKPVNFKVVVARLNTHIHVKETAEAIAQSANRRADDHMARAAAIVNNSDTAILTLTEGGVIESFNPGAEKIFNRPANDVIGHYFSTLVAEPCWADDGLIEDEVLRTEGILQNSLGFTREIMVLDHANNNFFAEMTLSSVELHERPIYTIILRDLTDEKAAKNKISRLSQTDSLTGLPNSSSFSSSTLRALATAIASHKIISLAYMDIDNFKDINEAYGHREGDLVLKHLAKRISLSLIDEMDIVSRRGGDEFQVLFTNLESAGDIDELIARVISAVEKPIEVEGNTHTLSVSVGLSLFPSDSADLDELIRMADVALFQAKSSGKSCYKIYDQSMHDETRRVKLLDIELQKTLQDKNGLSVHFQPQIDMHSLSITGYECLIRWFHDELGFIRPDEFIPVAESSNLIVSLGDFVYEQALLFVKALEQQGDKTSVISVNISPSELVEEGYVEKLQKGLKDHQVAAGRIQLEITERVIIDDSVDVASLLGQVRDIGMSISIDDFGTGYSSLSYIKDLPIDELKIDKSFIDGLPHDQDHTAITEAVIGMAKAMRLHIVSEGVEEAEQLMFLRQRYSGSVQGYLFSKALPMADALAWSLNYRDALPEGVSVVESPEA